MKSCQFVVIVFVLFLTGCSPFGNSSLIEQIGGTIADIFSSKTTADMNSGGSQNIISVPYIPGNAHEIKVSVGSVYQQNSFATAQGHTVEVIISGTTQ